MNGKIEFKRKKKAAENIGPYVAKKIAGTGMTLKEFAEKVNEYPALIRNITENKQGVWNNLELKMIKEFNKHEQTPDYILRDMQDAKDIVVKNVTPGNWFVLEHRADVKVISAIPRQYYDPAEHNGECVSVTYELI